MDDDKHISSMRNFNLGLFVRPCHRTGADYTQGGGLKIIYMVVGGEEKEDARRTSKCKSATSSAKINDTEQINGKYLTKCSQL